MRWRRRTRGLGGGRGSDVTAVAFLIVGTPRSGTTLVQRLACEISGVTMPPETHFLSGFVGGLLARRRFPLLAGAIREETERYLAEPTSVGLRLDPASIERQLGGRCDSPLQLFGALVRGLSGPGEVWGEKTPGHLRWWRPVVAAAPETKFVAVVRDPRAVVASSLRLPWRRDPSLAGWRGDLHRAFAGKWRHDQRLVLALARALGSERSLVLRYESVVADPEAARLSLAELLGRPAAERQPAPEGIVLSWETWKSRALGPVEQASAPAWREALSRRQCLEIADLCRGGMEAFGYAGVPARLGSLVRVARGGREAYRRQGRLDGALAAQQRQIDATQLGAGHSEIAPAR